MLAREVGEVGRWLKSRSGPPQPRCTPFAGIRRLIAVCTARAPLGLERGEDWSPGLAGAGRRAVSGASRLELVEKVVTHSGPGGAGEHAKGPRPPGASWRRGPWQRAWLGVVVGRPVLVGCDESRADVVVEVVGLGVELGCDGGELVGVEVGEPVVVDQSEVGDGLA